MCRKSANKYSRPCLEIAWFQYGIDFGRRVLLIEIVERAMVRYSTLCAERWADMLWSTWSRTVQRGSIYIYTETPACSWPSLRPVLGRDTFWPLAPALGSQPDAFYDRGITFPINCFLNNGAPSPKIVGMPILFRKRRLSFARAMGLLIQMQLDVC